MKIMNGNVMIGLVKLLYNNRLTHNLKSIFELFKTFFIMKLYKIAVNTNNLYLSYTHTHTHLNKHTNV